MSVVRRFEALGFALAILLSTSILQGAVAKAPVLTLPLDCIAQKTCFIQNYVDVDASSGVSDYACDKASYDGHKGVDFRVMSIRDLKKGVRVLASAPGRVKALRNGMLDRLISSKEDPRVTGRECGNGLVIDHGAGWETQYCHMRKGSLVVKKGQHVKRGQKLGLIGLSGKTAFPHVHLSVRHNGKVVDPFNGATPSSGVCKIKGKSLWQKKLLAAFPYISGQPFIWGFTNQPVKKQVLMKRGGVPLPRSVKARALVFFGQALNLQKGDQMGIILRGPKGTISKNLSKPMNRHKAVYLTYAGKKRINYAWPAGSYKGSFSLYRKGKRVWRKTETLELK